MSKISITEAVKIIPVSESTLRRDLKSGKVSFEVDPKGRKQIDVSELQRVYEQLKTNNGSQPPTDDTTDQSEPVNDTSQTPSLTGNETRQNPSVNKDKDSKNLSMNGNDSRQNLSMNGNDSRQNLSMNGNDSQKVIELLEGQVEDLKERLEKADTEKARLLELANNLQKQNEILMLPSPHKKTGFWDTSA